MRNLDANAQVAVTTGANTWAKALDVVVGGSAVRVIDPRELQEAARAYVAKYREVWRFVVGGAVSSWRRTATRATSSASPPARSCPSPRTRMSRHGSASRRDGDPGAAGTAYRMVLRRPTARRRERVVLLDVRLCCPVGYRSRDAHPRRGILTAPRGRLPAGRAMSARIASQVLGA